MKVFLTGTTGFIGSQVLEQLLSHKHEVSALVRREEDARNLTARGVTPVLGSLESLDAIADAAKGADATLHLAFIHNFAEYDKSIQTDLTVTQAIISALAGSGKKLITTSGTLMGGDSGNGLLVEGEPGKHSRGMCETETLKGVDQGVQSIVLRLPIYVYNESSFVSFMVNVHVEAAKKNGFVSYIGTGSQKFSVAHVDDVAAAYVAAAENAPTSGIYNIAGEHSIRATELAAAVSKKLSKSGPELPLRGLDQEQAAEVYKGLSFLFSLNSDVDNSKAKKDFNWQPHRTSGFLNTVASSA